MLSPEGLCRSQEATTPNLTSKTFYPPLGPLEPHKAYLPTPILLFSKRNSGATSRSVVLTGTLWVPSSVIM